MSDPANSNADKKRGRPFEKGTVPNPAGRPKGSRNKLGEAFIQALQSDFEEHGEKVIETVRIEKPDQYLKVIASILPKELNVNTNALGEMSDDELAAIFASLRTLADTVAPALGAGRAGPPEGAEPAPRVLPVH